MKNDISKLSFNEHNHYLGVFQQMGRVPLDADFNEQNELMLRMVQRFAGDAVRTGSPNNGFRVDTRLLLDACDKRDGWVPVPGNINLYIDYLDHRVGDGSLVVFGATAVAKTLEKPIDLRSLVEVVVYAKGGFAAANLVFTVSDGAISHNFAMTELAPETGGWRVFRAVPGAWPAAFAAERVMQYGFSNLDAAEFYSFEAVRVDAPIYSRLLRTILTRQFTATPNTATLAQDDDLRIAGGLSFKVSGATQLSYAIPAPQDLSRARALHVPLRRSQPAATFNVTLVDGDSPAHTLTLSGATTLNINGWEVLRYALPQVGTFTWSNVVEFRLGNLSAAESYWIGNVLLEVDPAEDLLIMGGDGTPEGAGRFYGDGLAAVKEAHESYFTQPQLPLADPSALDPVNEDQHRIDWAYLHLWERPLSYIEQPPLREIALEGQDTCTRTQLVAQVRLLKGLAVPLANEPSPPANAFATLPRWGKGTLSTKDKPAATLDPCADPCEPEIAGPYLGEGDRLFRVEIHRAGNISNDIATSALAKWSRDNAAIACPLLSDALVGATSAIVERPDLFAIGDLIELSDDLVELITGAYEDRINHRAHTRGALRRIVTVNLQTRRISWEDPTALDPAMHAPLSQPMRLAYHAKITKWDGLIGVQNGDLMLADGVTIEFGGSDFIAGDYWLFTTRVVDRSVERLIEAPPRGIRHAYYPLAAIRRSREAGEAEIVHVEDLRARFAPLTKLDASRIAYDPGAGVGLLPDWEKIGTVQEAIDAFARGEVNADMRLHHRLLHGYGVVCGLKMSCAKDREYVMLGKGYAIDCEGYIINLSKELPIDIVSQAASQGLLDAAGDGKCEVRIERSLIADADIEIEPHVPQGFMDSVLEGTLIKDFYDEVILAYVNFFKANFLPFPDGTVPLSPQHQRVLSCINLFWQLINGASGPYIFLSRREHDMLAQLHQDFQDLLASKTYCAMFDNLQVFPPYPYPAANPGIDTIFAMMKLHHRMKLSPDGRYAYSYGLGNMIQCFDLTTRELIEALTFPGGTNVHVMDIAFKPDGSEFYAVGLMSNSVDSVFATANIGAGQSHSWGPTTVVCDIKFVRLAMHAAQPNTLYAIGRSATMPAKRGLYTLIPNAISLTPSPALNFNATGLLEISANGLRAYAAASSGAVDTNDFNRIQYITLAPLALTGITGPIFGNEFGDDLKQHNGTLYVTGAAIPNGPKFLVRVNDVTAIVFGSIALGVDNPNRLAVLPARNQVWISHADRYKASVYEINTNVIRNNFRVPLQVVPTAMALTPDGSQVVALNMLGTLSLVDVAVVDAVAPPSYTLEIGNTLPPYRADAIKAFTDLFSVFAQSLKDAFCDKFLIECPTCDKDDLIYLGTVEIKGKKVHHICNFNKRHYAKSFRTWSYWLSTVPILPLFKRAFAAFCCKVL